MLLAPSRLSTAAAKITIILIFITFYSDILGSLKNLKPEKIGL
jgi:hypothetical protein